MGDPRTIEQRAAFLDAVTFTPSQRDEHDRVLTWVLDYPEDAAWYLLWLEDALHG